MNKMKKLLALLMGGLMVLSLAGFTPSTDAKKAYTAASKKTAKLTSLKTELDIEAGITLDGTTIASKINLRALERLVGEKYEMALVETVSFFGEQEKMAIYCKDGWIYQNDSTGAFKQQIAPEDIPDTMGTMGMGESLAPYLTDASIRPSGENWSVSYKVSTEELNELFSQLPPALGDIAEIDPVNLRINSISGTALIDKNGYLASEKIKMGLTAKMEGVPVKLSINITSKYAPLAKDAAIPFPDNLNSYTTVTDTNFIPNVA